MEGKPIQLFIGIIALTLVACAETGSQVSHQSSLTDMPPITAPTEIAPSLVVTDTLMSATELVPTSTPPPTIQSTPTEILPTPDFIDSPLVDGFLISPSLDSDCQLPCWHGLRVGESDREDVQRMFDETLGFNGMLDFFTEHRLPEVTISTFHLDLPGTQATGHEWAAPPMAGFFGLYMLVDEDTGILQGIQLVLTSSYDTYPYELLSAQQVLRELGTPSSIYARRDFGIPPGRALYLFLIYNDMGIATFLDTKVSIGEGEDYSGDRDFEDFCFDKASEVEKDYIVEPFDDLWDDNLPLIHKEWIVDIIEEPLLKMVSAEEIFDMSIEEITEVAVREENPCIKVDFTPPD